MDFRDFLRHFFLSVFVCLAFAFCANGAGVIPPGITQLADSGSSSNPAMWWLESNYVSSSESEFTIGGAWNYLTISSGYRFTASNGLSVGTTGRENNKLDIQAGSSVLVNGNFYCGRNVGISTNSRNNKTFVSGNGARLEVTENLQLGSGSAWLITNNVLNISNNGVVIVDSDKSGTGNFGVANHWSYGNSWLELDGGLLAIYGDKTANFAYGAGILSSIKVWDDVSESFQRLAYYSSTTWIATDYIDLLSVEYITDAAYALSLGISDEFVGFTVVQNIPEPATVLLLSLGGLAILRRRNS